MARIRSIKPDFFTSEDVSALPLRARLTWIGLWTHCDDHGRTKDNVKLIKAAVWPLDDVSLKDIEEDLGTLADRTRIVRYTVDDRAYLAVVNWHDHQAIPKPSKPRCPPPLVPVDGVCSHGDLPEQFGSTTEPLPRGRERKGGEQGGDARGTEPHPRCPKHIGSPDSPPCRACGDARRAHDAWVRAQKAKPTPSGIPDPGEKRCTKPGHESYIARNCAGCRSEALEAS